MKNTEFFSSPRLLILTSFYKGFILATERELLLEILELLTGIYSCLEPIRMLGAVENAHKSGMINFIAKTNEMREKNAQAFLPEAPWERFLEIRTQLKKKRAINLYHVLLRAYADQEWLRKQLP